MDLITRAAKIVDGLTDADALTDGFLIPIDKELESLDDSEKRKLIELLDRAEEKIGTLGVEKRDWWMAELYYRKGRCAREVFEREREYSFWKKAWEFADKSDNHEVQLQSSLELGFTFVEFSASIRDILEIQMNCVRAICESGVATTSRLRIIGINLFDFWRQLEYRRLSEHDLKAKQFIIDSAKNLEKAGFDDHSAAPIMILLISRVYDFEAPCLEWAHMETAIPGIPIPDEVQGRIK